MIKVIIWGTGKAAKRYMDKQYKQMKGGVKIIAFIDNDIIKQKMPFFGYPVISYDQIHKYLFDYIVIINAFANEIYEQIGNEFEKEKTVILLPRLIELFVSSDYLKDKKILFYGDSMNYELVEYRARFTFCSIQYLEKNHLIPIENIDFVFLCPPRLIAPQEKTCYEIELRREVHNTLHICDENVLEFNDWFPYLKCDREITGGNKNKEKKFFIIASSDPLQGWGNILVRVWGGIAYAYSQQMIPVIDMKNLKNQYLPEKLIGKHNAWEDFFEPINEYDLDEIYESCHVILGGIDVHIDGSMELESTVYKQSVALEITQTYKKLFPEEGKVLGVIYRGTDYNRAYGHVSSGDLGGYIQYVKQYLHEINYDYIFLATEVEEAVQAFKQAFGKKVFWVEQKRYSASEQRWLYSIHFERENDAFKKGMEYLTVIDLLSRCNAVIGTDTGTIRAAVILNQKKYNFKKYEYINILHHATSFKNESPVARSVVSRHS